MTKDLSGGDLGDLMLLFYAGAAAVAALGVYGLKKAGVEGPKVWLGVAAAPIVWYGAKAFVDSRNEQREAANATYQAARPTTQAPQAIVPLAPPLKGLDLLSLYMQEFEA